MQSFFLAIEGVIGVGKTTLARLLQPRFDTALLLEAFEENPFLSDFYGDRARYAFQTQIFFLLSRYRQQQEVPAGLTRDPLIADYTFAKDNLFAQMNLAGDELRVYKHLYDVLSERTRLPDLVVYLRAELDLLMLRIAMRDRAYERDMDRAYIESLRQVYERFFSTYAETPLLTIEVDGLDYVQDPGALDFIEGQIRAALGIGAYQQPLPQMESVSLLRIPAALAERVDGDIAGRSQGEAAGQGGTGRPDQRLDVAHYLAASVDVKDVLTRVGARAREALEADGCAIYLLEPDGGLLTPVVAIEPPDGNRVLSAPLDVEACFIGQAIQARHGLIVNDVPVEAAGHPVPGVSVREDERVIVTPFVVDDKVLGAMCLNRVGIALSEEDLAVIETFATYAAVALKNAQAYGELQRQVLGQVEALGGMV